MCGGRPEAAGRGGGGVLDTEEREGCMAGGRGNSTGDESGFGEMGSEGLGVTPARSCPSSAQKSLVEMSTRVWLPGSKGLRAFPVPSQSPAAR